MWAETYIICLFWPLAVEDADGILAEDIASSAPDGCHRDDVPIYDDFWRQQVSHCHVNPWTQ